MIDIYLQISNQALDIGQYFELFLNASLFI